MQNCYPNQNDYNYNNCCGDPTSCSGPCPADYAGYNNGWNTPAYAGFNGYNNGCDNGWNPTATTWNGFANVPAPETTVPGGNPTQNFGPQSWTGCCSTEAA
ncbi:MAG: hypothetical protein P8J59_06600 [Phycisphaerales bacterium]|nr:hypothetical protein [Phycisphaerales bacterium]